MTISKISISLSRSEERALARAMANLAKAKNLDEVHEALMCVHQIIGDEGMSEWHASGISDDEVPTFGPEPYHIQHVWSWDRMRVLKQTESGGFDEAYVDDRGDRLDTLVEAVEGVIDAENLVELRDALNDLQYLGSFTDEPSVEDYLDFDDLPRFGGENVALPGIHAWDEDGVLVRLNGSWSIEPRSLVLAA